MRYKDKKVRSNDQILQMEGMRGSWSKDKNRKMMEWSQNNEIRWEIKRFLREARLVKTSGEREKRWLE